jgi:hypothetical protein
MIISGGSGCGKSTLLLHMLLTPGFLDYERLYIFTSTPKQDIYQFLHHGFSNGLSKEILASVLLKQAEFKDIPIPSLMKKLAEVTSSHGQIEIMLVDKTDELKHPDELDSKSRNLVVFDDCISMVSQSIFKAYFSRGRHNSCNVIYLTQSYFSLDQMIRLNANFIILFKLNPRNLGDIYSSVLGESMDKQKFMTLARNTFTKKYNYLAIDKDKDKIMTDIFTEASLSDDD